MNALRLMLALALAGAALIAIRLPATSVAILALALFGLRAAVGWSLRNLLQTFLPVALFAGTVALLQWINGTTDFAVPVRTIAVFLLLTLATSLAPWEWIAAGLSPRSRWYHAGLFLLFVRHFVVVLTAETRRTLQARAMSAPRLLHPGGATALAQALVSICRRTLIRAERFYAAQSLNGIAQ